MNLDLRFAPIGPDMPDARFDPRPKQAQTRRDAAGPAAPPSFTPRLALRDELAAHWLRQVVLRLRREVCWLWRERSAQGAPPGLAPLPPVVDAALNALDLLRYAGEREQFFASDTTARHLSALIDEPAPAPQPDAPRGSFSWVAADLALDDGECFVLALALLPVLDSAAGPVLACCANDASRQEPSLALAQRLWPDQHTLQRCVDPLHPLSRCGLLSAQGSGWSAALSVPAPVAHLLLHGGDQWPAAFQAAAEAAPAPDVAAHAFEGMRLVPVIGPLGAALLEAAAQDAALRGERLVPLRRSVKREQLAPLLTTAWLLGGAICLQAEQLLDGHEHEHGLQPPPLPELPLTLYIGTHDRGLLAPLHERLQPAVEVGTLDFGQRLAAWQRALPALARSPVLREVAQRFRHQALSIARIGERLAVDGGAPTRDALFAAARTDLDLGALAQRVTPRFSLDELMLPALQSTQVEEIVTAMRNLNRAHHDWGNARAWNEGGLSALFAGAPGTGKTMCAEALASELDLPLYRIDLSQVVNKYIGETEKNLKRLFDAADAADLILFFDEADSLFGKRTEVKDAHDRYANLEVSYLLERMERFKGLALLATNRKKDLDEAFLRRLRFVIEFPLPGVEERARIWRSVLPPQVDCRALDIDFLAQRFALAGGHIRAIVFHACLQAAGEGAAPALDMPAVILAVKREYDKLERAHSLDQFGPYAPLVAAEGRRR